VTAHASPLRCTYRLQLHGIGFGRAAALVPYLSDLGIDTLYVSPLAAATTGSSHGYDVVDPTRLDPALGTAEELEALLAALDRRGMRLLVDIVPNHMATGEEDGWWVDVLRRGPASPYARVFDVDWDAGDGKVVLPVLAVPFADALEGGDITLELGNPDDAGRTAVVRYRDRSFPVSPEATAAALALIDEGRPSGGGGGRARRLGSLDALLDAQHYRLVFWRVGRHLVNYRRFFDIDGLVGVRVEDPDVYALTHRLVFELAADERVAGVDGLTDPTAYLVRLHADLSSRRRTAPVLLVEKILAAGECLPAGWPVAGTTGYEFASLAVDLFVDPAGAARAPAGASFAALAVQGRREALEASFPGQVTRLAREATGQATRRRSGRDLAEADVRRALVAVTARLDVYRTYLADGPPSESDQARIEAAFDAAASDAADPAGAFALRELRRLLLDPTGAGADVARRWQQLTSAVAAKGVEDTALYRFAGLLVAADVGSDPSPPPYGAVCRFHAAMAERARLWPGALNATSTHDAKRSEDVRARLAVLSEMPEEWARLTAGWHERYLSVERASSASGRALPRSVAETFYQMVVGAWPLDRVGGGGFEGRVREAVRKSAREAKTYTSWTDPDREFESRLDSFVTASLGGGDGSIVAGVEQLVARIGPAAAVNSLSLVVLKTTAPGVPDVYQGTEMWRPLLVDPDNRRPVDFTRLAAALASLPARGDGLAHESLLADWDRGAMKLYVLQRALRARAARPALFAAGDYVPLEARGSGAEHVVAFARRRGREWAVAVVPRLVLGLAGPSAMPTGESVWQDTEVSLPIGSSRSGRDALTDSAVAAPDGLLRLADLLEVLPVAVVLF
jgi:malto-oligosyltrehalose synthase